MRIALLAIAAVATLALAGCAGNSTPSTSAPASSYEVKVMKNHALQSKTRTIKADLVQGGQVVGTGTFTLSKADPQSPVLAFTKTVGPGAVQIKAYEGGNPVGVKSLDPAKCPAPLEFELHVVDDAVHLYSNCD